MRIPERYRNLLDEREEMQEHMENQENGKDSVKWVAIREEGI